MPLKIQSIELIKATYPLLHQQGVQVTKRMYQILFAAYPECEALFKSTENQPEKLANSILAFVGHIEDIEQLATTLENIANKHVAARVKAVHYPMVADALITAMQQVIGSAVFNNKVADAWIEAYTFLATHLMSVENDLYAAKYNQQADT